MKRQEGSWLLKTLVSGVTIAMGAVLSLLVILITIWLGAPPSFSWLAYVIVPVVICGFYVPVSLTALGKYLWEWPPWLTF
jgi:hypothetical protein